MQRICFSSLCKVCPSVVLLWKRGGVSRKMRRYLTSVDRTSHLNGFVSDREREREEKHSNEVAFGSAKALQDFLCFRTKIQYKYKFKYQQLQQFFPFEGVTDSSWVTATLIFRLERPHKKRGRSLHVQHSDAALPTQIARKQRAAVGSGVGLSHSLRCTKFLARTPPQKSSRHPPGAAVPLPASPPGMASPQGGQLSTSWGSNPVSSRGARRGLANARQASGPGQQGSAMSWWATGRRCRVQDSGVPLPKPAGSFPALSWEDATERCCLRGVWRITIPGQALQMCDRSGYSQLESKN